MNSSSLITNKPQTPQKLVSIMMSLLRGQCTFEVTFIPYNYGKTFNKGHVWQISGKKLSFDTIVSENHKSYFVGVYTSVAY